MYNAETTIEKVLSSVVQQTYQGDKEIIIVNDGSTDQSVHKVNSFIGANSNVNIQLIEQVNSGVSTARNVGLQKASGDWLCLLDSDDVWLPQKLELQLQVLEKNPHIDFLGTTRNGERINRIFFKKLSDLQSISARDLLVKFVFVTPTIIFRREILAKVGFFDQTQKFAEEGNYFIRIAKDFNCYLLNTSLVITGDGKHHFGESGLSSNLWEMEKGELKNIKDSYRLGIINIFEYPLLVIFSILKYLRRVFLVRFR